METTAAPKLLPHLWKSTLLSGILSLTLGILVYVLPEHSIVAAAALFGIYLLVTGAAQVFFAFTLHVSAGGRVLSFISGAASLVLAVLCFRHFGQGYAILLLAIWIGIGFIFRGVATSISAISDPLPAGPGLANLRRRGQPVGRHRDARISSGNDRDPDAGRRDLADRHRRLRDRFLVRHPQCIPTDREGCGRNTADRRVSGASIQPTVNRVVR